MFSFLILKIFFIRLTPLQRAVS
uniref:Uncharacterized protein n=1 Tax=Anguilla anguilla TaxID=7936 RepID=A0A0E9SI54_ANGAN